MGKVKTYSERVVVPRFVGHTERSCEYAIEALEPIDVTEADRERGRRFTEAIRALRSNSEGVFAGMDMAGDYQPMVGVRRGGVIIVEPVYPVRRLIRRADMLYPHLSPNEITYSDRPILVERFQFFDADERHDSELRAPDAVPAWATSPHYNDNATIQDLVEVTDIDVLAHPISIHPIEGYMRHRPELQD